MSTIKVDTITDEAGTGAPDFPQGMTGDGSSLTGLATAAQGALADSAVQPNTSPTFGTISASSLTGVGSIDSTTATAIGNAGVGGAMSLISTTSLNANVGYIDVLFPSGYTNYLINILGLVCPLAMNIGGIQSRLLDTSNNPVTGSNRYGYGATNTAFSNAWKNMGEVGSNTSFYKSNFHIEVMSPRDSSVCTTAKCTPLGSYQNNGTLTISPINMMSYRDPGQHNGLRIFHQNSSYGSSISFSSASNKILLWGIK